MNAEPRRPRPEPVRPSEKRVEQLRALAEWHHQWVDKHLPNAPFDAERAAAKPGSDYNQHYLDIEADPAVLDEYFHRAREIMGLDPITGEPL